MTWTKLVTGVEQKNPIYTSCCGGVGREIWLGSYTKEKKGYQTKVPPPPILMSALLLISDNVGK